MAELVVPQFKVGNRVVWSEQLSRGLSAHLVNEYGEGPFRVVAVIPLDQNCNCGGGNFINPGLHSRGCLRRIWDTAGNRPLVIVEMGQDEKTFSGYWLRPFG